VVVTASQGIPVPRRTGAVTVAGALFLLLAVVFAFMAVVFGTEMAFPGSFSDGDGDEPIGLFPVGVGLAGAAIFGCAGLAVMGRWRGWRIWAGTVSWGLIVMVVLGLFAPPPPSSTDRWIERVVSLIVVAVAVFVLVAKRRERRPDIAAVFDP
jgi:hypothetical protein